LQHSFLCNRRAPGRSSAGVPGQREPDPLGTVMNVMTPMTAGDAEDLMTRRQVAYLYGVTSAAVAAWARRGLLREVRDQDGRPR
jgi:hypothetical protein